ncbi:MAG: hypothetical protein DRJ14_03220 [Acidobacteria bacterium]|nr:MAG: hypothetical protein DRJ14_03220 [Acidobacteriota bacterium]
MALKVKFVICLHSHQPVGNLDFVFEDVYRQSYAPFLNVFEKMSEIPVSLHYSGPLLEWLDTHYPEYLDKIAEMVDRGQVEMVGGAFYEPILTLLPTKDRIAQIKLMQHYLLDHFQADSSGFWLAERVWEQSLVAELADAAVRYTLVDHTHFNYGGFEGVPGGYYTAEDRGRAVTLFPINEDLRYLIPFSEPEKVLAYLKKFLNKSDDEAIVVYADDGEKFGSWPGTHELVYTEKWLERFLKLAKSNEDWLELTSFEKILRENRSSGLAYLPDASYREMMEWSLEPEQQARLDSLYAEFEKKPEQKVFIRGGSYRNFRKKYPESFLMYARMLSLSKKADTEESRTFLYRSQCNCAYWHGVFGGIYLPHLRNAIFENIIAGEKTLNEPAGITATDMDLDGRDEWIVNTEKMKLIFDPDRGGRLLSWDLKEQLTNFQSTFTRRPEYYHHYVTEGGAKASEMTGVHDTPLLKEPDLKKDLAYDSYQRVSILEHRFSTVPTPEEIRTLQFPVDLPFIERPLAVNATGDRLEMLDHRFGVNKTIQVDKNTFSVKIHCKKEDNSPLLAVEWNLFTLSPTAPDKGFFANGEFIGHAGTESSLEGKELQFRDEYRGFSIAFQLSEPAEIVIAPLYTVNLSESGIERVFQNSTIFFVMPMPFDHALKLQVQYTQLFS